MASNEKLQKNDSVAKMDSNIFQSLVGSLIYLTILKHDLLFSISIICRFIEDPSRLHFATTKRILQYLWGKKDHGILYKKQKDNRLIGFSNSDRAGSYDDRNNKYNFMVLKEIEFYSIVFCRSRIHCYKWSGMSVSVVEKYSFWFAVKSPWSYCYIMW